MLARPIALGTRASFTNTHRSLPTTSVTSSHKLSGNTALKRQYHERVIDHYEKPRNVGSFSKNDPDVGTGLVGAPACGDVMKLQIKANEQGVIESACFKTFGCGSAIASSSLATEWVRGKTLDEALEIRNTDIAKHLSLPPVKLHCSMLAEDAIKAAVKDLKKKRAESQHSTASTAANAAAASATAATATATA